MAYTLIGATARYIGKSTDQLPNLVTHTTLSTGSRAYQTDTGTTLIWDGATWTVDETATAGAAASGTGASADTTLCVVADLLTEQLVELRKLRFGLERYLELEFADPGE